MAESSIVLKAVSKIYEKGAQRITILDALDLEIPAGSFEALMGPSGSGKTTLLNLIAGLDQPTSGAVRVAGQEVSSMTPSGLTEYRSRTVGFIFQQYNLIPVLTAVENVELPLLATNLSKRDRQERAMTSLKAVGLQDRSGHYPSQLSGGQEQRVSIARAIVTDPKVIVADEPTGDLDRKSADEALLLLQRLNQEYGKTILMVTHDPEAADCASVTHRLNKGRIIQSI